MIVYLQMHTSIILIYSLITSTNIFFIPKVLRPKVPTIKVRMSNKDLVQFN